MCTYLTEKVSISGSGKGPSGWFRLTDASRARAGEAGEIESILARAGQAAIPARRVRSSMAAW